ncbi:Fis family transcriptional regulator [Planctomycetota bacterium]|nr:Fis family transcriptional regulator [Planctomycetota bacterium]
MTPASQATSHRSAAKRSTRRPLVAIGLLGPTLDAGRDEKRWNRWRPTVGLHMQDDLAISRFEMLHQRRFDRLADGIAADIAKVSPDTQVTSRHIEFTDPWDFEEVYGALWGFARKYAWNPEAEDYLVHITTGTHVAQICLFLLTESRHLPARLVQTQPGAKRGPEDLRSPEDASGRGSVAGTHAIIDLDLSKYDQLASRFAEERRAGVSVLTAGIPTRNPVFAALISRIEQVAAATRAPILLGGPTGAGKTVLARRIYELKKSRNLVEGPFVELNCATVRGDAAGSALFGHRKGAFTGATADRPGLLRRADDGVLFLDEIGELGHDEQAMLLRAIEDKVFLPVGADVPVLSDFQLIAGSNRDLREAVRAGRFREDLLARIDLWTFRLPGLAERREDIEPNLDFELERFAKDSGKRVTMNSEARADFLAFATAPAAAWQANFRDLGAAVTRMATLAVANQAGRIDAALVREETGRLHRQWHPPAPDDDGLAILGQRQLDRFDQVQLADVVRVCRRSRTLSEAGRILFAVSRQERKHANDADRLQKYLARFDLTWDQVVGDQP